MDITAGATSQVVPFFVQDTTRTDGGGFAGMVYNSSGIIAEYRRQGASGWNAFTLVAGTLGTYVNSGGAGTGGGFIADGALTGAYEVCVPDAAFAVAGGVNWVIVRLYGVANALAREVLVQLQAAGGDTAGTTTLLSRLTSTRAGYLDNLTDLDVASSSLATAANLAEANTDLDELLVGVTVSGYASGQDPATLVLDSAQIGHNIAGSIGYDIGHSSAGAGVDPLLSAVPGSYGAGTAGAALGNIDATVSSRASTADIASLPTDATIATDVQTGLTSQGYTGARAVKLDDLDAAVSSVSSGVADAVMLEFADGNITVRQALALLVDVLTDADRTWDAATHTAVYTWFRRTGGSTDPSGTPILTKTTVYDATNTQVVSSACVFNLP